MGLLRENGGNAGDDGKVNAYHFKLIYNLKLPPHLYPSPQWGEDKGEGEPSIIEQISVICINLRRKYGKTDY
jgi:hypothetical protein